MRTAIHRAARFDPVSDDLAIAVGTGRRHRMDSALEAVEGHGSPGLGYLEGLVVFVATNIACGHGILRPALPERRDQCRVLFDNGSRWRWFRRRNGNFALDRAAFPDHRKRPEKQGSNAQ